MSSTLLELSTIIATAVASLNEACADNGTPFPALETPFSLPSEAFRANPQAAEAANVIAAAATQLAAMVLPPPSAMFSLIMGHLKSAALRVCLQASVTEILREGGPQGVHVNEIAKIANISSDKIGRLLRYLATHHVYKELRPNVFTNTRISSMLDTGKSMNEILANPDKKHDDTSGFAALAGCQLDELTKSSAYLWENMSDPAVAHSMEVNHAPFNRAFNWDGPLWTFFNQPEQRARQRIFGIGMQGVAALKPADAILKAFDWASLPHGSVVVDVGGGVGTSSLVLAKNLSNVKLVVQDRPPVVNDAKLVWKKELPEAIDSGRVVLQAHDFFGPQPVKNASVFLLKHVIHNWPDVDATRILLRLREVANRDTKLILIDNIVSFACHDPSGDNGECIPGAVPKDAPMPLLANYGIANEMGYNIDLTMLVACNTQARTVQKFVDLLQKSGWRLTEVARDASRDFLQPLIATPIFLSCSL